MCEGRKNPPVDEVKPNQYVPYEEARVHLECFPFFY